MGNTSGRLAVTRKSSGKQATTTDEKAAETHDLAAKDVELVDKENLEPPVDSKVEEANGTTNGHLTNGHSTNGHAVKSDETGEHLEKTTEENIEVNTTEHATESQNVSTTSESKKRNPLKWLKKNISFKKEKRSKKDSSTLEENVEDAQTEKTTDESPVVESSAVATESELPVTTPESHQEETPVIVLTSVEVEPIAGEIEPSHTEQTHVVENVSNLANSISTKEQPHHPTIELNGHVDSSVETTLEIKVVESVNEPTTEVQPLSQEVTCNGE